jgi:hypothetical protein
LTTKKCSKCKQEKDVGEFYKSDTTKDGYRHYCKQCEKQMKNESFNKNYLKKVLQLCISRAKKTNTKCDSLEELYNYLKPIYDIGECEKCHIKLENHIGKGGVRGCSPSIDRIMSHDGYIVGNIALLCNYCNGRKQNNDLDDFRSWVSWMEERVSNIYATKTEKKKNNI